MPIIRCTDQNNETLEDFYTKGNDQRTREMGANMFALIKSLDTKFKTTSLFGLTSLYRLVLLSQDTYNSPWYVIFSTDGQVFYIDYLVPESKRPRANARLTGEAKFAEEAFKYILIAMKESEGWKDNEELNKLLADTLA